MSDTIECKNCQKEISYSSRKCKYCGAWTSSSREKASEHQNQQRRDNQRETDEVYKHHEDNKECPYCLSAVPASAEKCKNCGEWMPSDGANNSNDQSNQSGESVASEGKSSGNLSEENGAKKENNFKKPKAGIAIALFLGLVSICWNGLSFVDFVTTDPSSDRARLMREFFPGVHLSGFISGLFGTASSFVLVLGAFVSLMGERAGNAVVRFISWIGVVVAPVLAFFNLFLILGSEGFKYASDQGFFEAMGAIIGAAIGNMIQWIVIIYFFRKSEYG
jgi:hypothetical protein